MDIDDNHDEEFLNGDTSPMGEGMSEGGTVREVLRRVEHDLAYSSEKVLNLEMLLMHVSGRANDHEAPIVENEDISSEFLVKAFEFDLLSGILNSEIKALESFMTSLQIEIVDACRKLYQSDFFGESSTEIEVKLHDAEESLKQSQDLVADLRKQSEKLERTLAFGERETCTGVNEELGNGNLPKTSSKGSLWTVEQQRLDLQMLEKSLARELDLEKKLSYSISSNEELKRKLHYAEREALSMEETVEVILERMFNAENAAELLMGISKELAGKIQVVQFNLNGAHHQECQTKSKLLEGLVKLSAEESALEKLKTSQAELYSFHVSQENSLKANLKEAEYNCILASSEALILREKVTTLEEQLRVSESQLQLSKASVEASMEQQSLLHSELSGLKTVVEGLRENLLETERRAENAEAKCTLLTNSNKELNEELGLLRNNGPDKANILERKLKESDTQLEHAKASVEAIEEQQNMLYSALRDMENLIEDLKGKVSKAENRALSAESKYALLTETNLELNEELGFLRGRLESLETSLHQTDDAKVATAKDIGIRTKIITDLVMKLALQRERLQLQISALAKENKILAEKCSRTKGNVPSTLNHNETKTGNEFSILKPSEAELSATNFQVGKSATVMSSCETSLETSVSSVDDSSSAESKLGIVRTIEVTQLNSKYLVMAFVVVLVSIVVVYLFQLENHYSQLEP